MEEWGKQHLSFWFCFCVAPFFSSVFSNFFCQVSQFCQEPPVSDRFLQVYRFIKFFSLILPIISLETISDSETVLSETYSFDAINHSQNIVESGKIGVNTLREKSPNTELFQVHKVTITNANFFVLTVSCLRTHQRKNFTSNN